MKGLVSIVGKSGCGKSTLLNLLCGIDKPNKGNVFFKNKDLSKINNKKLKEFQNKEIGILFQHFNLFDDLTCLENVIIPAQIDGMSNKKAIKIAKTYFEKFNLVDLMNRKYETLSGGEKQRISLIRCLINDPDVIIADEPTGALDSKNSILIMDELKLLSKEKLVIVVTHNELLIKDYEDYRVDFNKGLILDEINYKNQFKIKRNNKINFSFIFKFIKLHLKKHLVRNIIVGASILFSSICVCLSIGYIRGSSISKENYTTKSLLYNFATISKKKTVEVPSSPIKISKLSRPNLLEIDFLNTDIKSIQIKNNYQIYFPNYPTFSYEDKEYSNINFQSYYSENSSLLTIGKYPNIESLNEVVVNEEFLEKFNKNKNDILNECIKLNFETTVNNSYGGKKNIKDKIEFIESLKIVGVVKEFSYLNEPRIYYSYQALDNYLNGVILTNYSKEVGSDTSAKQMVTYADETDANSGYSYYLFVENLSEVNKLFEYKKQFDISNNYEIESLNYTIKESYISLVDIVSSSLIIFMSLTILGLVMIVVISSFSNYIQNKKESAILSILGLRKNNLFFIYNLENLLVTISSFVISICLIYPLKLLANNIIYKFSNLENAIIASAFSWVSFIIFFALVLISTLSSLIPFLFYENNYILEELKDE